MNTLLRHLGFALLVPAALAAQASLTTTFADNNGLGSGAVTYFDIDANVGVSIVAFDLNISATAGTNGTIDVFTTAPGGTYVGNQTNAGAWTLVASSASFTSAGRGQPTNAQLLTPVLLPPGNHGIAIAYNGVGVAYTNGTGANQTYANADITLRAGSATPNRFSGLLFDPRVFNGTVYYLPGSNFARAIPYGAGCGATGSALGLRGVARPVIGATASVETVNIPAGSPSGTLVFGLSKLDPGLDLTPFGMPSCFLHVSTTASLPFAPSGNTSLSSLPIPNDPSLAGASVYLQSVVVAIGANPLNLLSSNGLEWVFDTQ